MDKVCLEKIDPARNQRRFYAIAVAPDLLGGWVLVQEWGRIGSPGTVRETRYPTEALAREAAATLRARKERRGYRATG
jgi:predicted DNA-binding WGR domain protein